MIQNRVFQMLGMAMKAGKTASGEFAVEKAIKDGTARLVLVAEDASENSRKLFVNKCTYYQIPYCVFGTKETLGKAIGKEYRSAIAVLDPGFAAAVSRKLEQNIMAGKNGGNASV